MPVVKLNGTSLYYETQGSGTALLFIHGHGWTHRMFKPQLDYFSDRYQVIACDLRGNGRSGELRQSPDDIIDTQSLDLIMLLNALHIREAVFVGIAYGGLIVQQIAAQYPERVKAIVIADSFCRSEASTLMGKLQLAAAYLSWVDYYAPGELLLPSLRLAYRRWGLAYSELRRNVLERRPRELYRQRLATRRIDYSAHLTEITRPALGVVGDYTAFGVERMKEVVAHLPQARLAIIPDANEPSSLCQPDSFNVVIEQFLERQALQPRREEGSG
ncbi:alpha/beta fold hydrolase [Cohnella sp. GCM10012308]|uniref:alpha/beta fold hydrolase n=1 Tax=Cohnella sp. GCM10012308 TaxID=3317329 RepID=UPI00361B842F